MTQNHCSLVLMPPPVDIFQNGGKLLDQALNNTGIAAIFIAPETREFPPLGDEGLKIAQKHNIAVLHMGMSGLQDLQGYDGAYLGQNADNEIIGNARKILGERAMIGADAGDTRHQAMLCAESGLDFISFGPEGGRDIPDLERIAWWSEIFVIPSLAMGEITLQNAAPLINAGADFLALPASIWSQPAGPRPIIGDFNRLIAEISAS